MEQLQGLLPDDYTVFGHGSNMWFLQHSGIEMLCISLMVIK